MLVAAAALAVLAASPALAGTQHGQSTVSHNSAMSDYDAAYGANAAANSGAYAETGPAGLYGSSPPVIFENRVVGQDPDPNVRMMIEKDPGLLAD
jgi:hypothetical protein